MPKRKENAIDILRMIKQETLENHTVTPTYPTKKEASRQGAIIYGSKKHYEYKVNGGWKTYPMKRGRSK